MMSSRLSQRVSESLDTVMAEVRPSPTERRREDYSYRLTEDAFILQRHCWIESSQLQATQALLKAVHADTPSGWLLYAPDDQGHWQPHADMSFSADLHEVLALARSLIRQDKRPAVLQKAG